jgi:hypothetical protein
MRRFLYLIVAAAVAGATAPATVASAAQAPPSEGVGIRLLEAPTGRADDPRARQYVVDHLAPGTTISRRFEVANRTATAKVVALYAAGATVEDGRFVFAEGRQGSELTGWTTVAPPELRLAPGAVGTGTVTIRVPARVTPGERYAVVWAEPPAATGGDVTLVNRVGIRVYASVGGKEPPTDFEVRDLVAARGPDGRPVVEATVRNTGGRAVDLAGELRLAGGPGGLSAGPFPVEVGTTVGPGSSARARVVLDPALPDGPWEARVSLRSGSLEREAEATITFPSEAGRSAPAVPATPSDRQRRIALPIAIALLAAVLVGLGLAARAWRRRAL